jgi:hypothetical protein
VATAVAKAAKAAEAADAAGEDEDYYDDYDAARVAFAAAANDYADAAVETRGSDAAYHAVYCAVVYADAAGAAAAAGAATAADADGDDTAAAAAATEAAYNAAIRAYDNTGIPSLPLLCCPVCWSPIWGLQMRTEMCEKCDTEVCGENCYAHHSCDGDEGDADEGDEADAAA